MAGAQAAILLALGLQRTEVKDLEAALQLPSNQVLALFNKVRGCGSKGQGLAATEEPRVPGWRSPAGGA